MRSFRAHGACDDTGPSLLLRRVAAGEEVIITRGGWPTARLVPIRALGLREVGCDREILDPPTEPPLSRQATTTAKRRGPGARPCRFESPRASIRQTSS
ncbi:MAG: type II toxin-antitoxin system Phd/YefM family antitoxin [Chloroflexota bacterium]